MIDVVRYDAGDEPDVYWPIARELCKCGVAVDPSGKVPTGLRNPNRLYEIGVIVDRRATHGRRNAFAPPEYGMPPYTNSR